MTDKNIPKAFCFLLSDMCVDESNIIKTNDGFYMIYKSLSDILFQKNIIDFIDSSGKRFECENFFDDWFLYAIPNENDYIYSLIKLREQEYDAEKGLSADGDTPGVTISFISFECKILLECIENPTDENRKKLNNEINRVVAYKGQNHHKILKEYFKNPYSQASYLVADTYIKYIASYVKNGCLELPKGYKEFVRKSGSGKCRKRIQRLPHFIESLNKAAGHVICDDQKIYIKNQEKLTDYESAAILATHTGNTSVYSFAAEVEYHARFLTPVAKVKIPFLGKSFYDSAIRADMSVGDTEFQGPAPFYNSKSKIVKRQYNLHH